MVIQIANEHGEAECDYPALSFSVILRGKGIWVGGGTDTMTIVTALIFLVERL